MNIKPIRTEKDYRAMLKRIDELIAVDPKEGTQECDELDVISTLVESYENIRYPIEAPDPVKAILYIMEECGLNQKDLIKYFNGSKGLVSAFLNGKRELSKNVIKSLHHGLGIPYEILMAG
jgi:Predicted transcription regulator containing HTH domain